MRLNYDTFTGRRSVFVLVAFLLILLFWAAYVVCAGQIVNFLSPHMGKNTLLAAQMLIQDGLVVLAVLVAAALTETKRSMNEKMGLQMDPGYSLRFLFPVFVLAALVTYGSQYGLTHLLKAFGHEPKPQSLVDFFRTLGPLAFAGFAAITVIAAPIAEELAFRHILYRLFRMVLFRKEAAVAVSLIFALFHVSVVTLVRTKPFPWEMLVVPVVPLFLLAMVLQWQYEKSKSVIPSVLLHAGFNLTTVFLLVLEVAYGKPQEAPAAEESAAPAETAVEAPAENGEAVVPAENDSAAPMAVPVQAVAIQWDFCG